MLVSTLFLTCVVHVVPFFPGLRGGPNPLSTCQLGTMESYDAPQLERFSSVTPSPLSISFVLRSWLLLFRSFCNSQRGMSIERTMNNKRDDHASLLEVEGSIPNAPRIFFVEGMARRKVKILRIASFGKKSILRWLGRSIGVLYETIVSRFVRESLRSETDQLYFL